ncbi:MAG: hypothetical protein U0136_21550 [Bdellovibrionota bacterium]
MLTLGWIVLALVALVCITVAFGRGRRSAESERINTSVKSSGTLDPHRDADGEVDGGVRANRPWH